MSTATDSAATAAQQEYRDALLRHGLLLSTGVAGVYGKSATFEQVLNGVNAAVSTAGRDLGGEVVWFPPVISSTLLAHTDYLRTFPHLTGTVHSFFGSERDHAALLNTIAERPDRWADGFEPTQLSLAPAACYPVYPSATGTLPDGGRTFDVQSYCYRHEPSDDPARLQMFRMHEYVRIGTPAEVEAFRDLWLERGERLLCNLGLDARAVVASDPFFGRGGRLLAEAQREQALKFELVVPISTPDHPTAVASCNYHRDHFGICFDIFTSDGARAHSACVGFGLERITLAVFKRHGFEPDRWPAEVRQHLGV